MSIHDRLTLVYCASGREWSVRKVELLESGLYHLASYKEN